MVAPGTFVVSTRSAQWDQNAYYNPTSYTYNVFPNQDVETNSLNNYSVFVPANAVQLIIYAFAIDPVVDLPIYVKQGDIPTTNDFNTLDQVFLPPDLALTTGTTWFFSVGNPIDVPVVYEVVTELVTTNDNGDYFEVLSNMNNGVGPYYRYESGTSMSAADVSGVLALMEDFFTNQLHYHSQPGADEGDADQRRALRQHHLRFPGSEHHQFPGLGFDQSDQQPAVGVGE